MTVPVKVRVNQDIYFYERTVSTVPLAAKVIQEFGDMVTLIVWYGKRWEERQCVMRRGSDRLKANPTLGDRNGVWDFMDPVPEERSAADLNNTTEPPTIDTIPAGSDSPNSKNQRRETVKA